MAALSGCGTREETPPLYVYVGGTMRPAMETLVKQYEKETGRKLEIDYGDSGENLIKVETSRRGDLYVAHDPFHGAIVHKGLGIDAWVVATLEPVIVVAKGNPKKIAGLADLAKPGVKVVLTDAEYSTAGHVWTLMFKKAGLAEAIQKNVVTTTRSGGEAANAVSIGNADAAIVWNAVQFLRRDKLDAVAIEPPFRPVPGADAVTSPTFGPIDMSAIRVTVDVLASSKDPAAARAFADFVASDRAAKVWNDFGFGPAPAERHLAPTGAAGSASSSGAAKPQGPLLIYAGASLRDALEDLVQAFTAKTGVKVESDYGGSGIPASAVVRMPMTCSRRSRGVNVGRGLLLSKGKAVSFSRLLNARVSARYICGRREFAAPGLQAGWRREHARQATLWPNRQHPETWRYSWRRLP
jgi:molybdate transport system substrate-binding protein